MLSCGSLKLKKVLEIRLMVETRERQILGHEGKSLKLFLGVPSSRSSLGNVFNGKISNFGENNFPPPIRVRQELASAMLPEY